MEKHVLLNIGIIIALCLGFSSCNKDEDNPSGFFYEITINGKTYKGNNPLSFMAVVPVNSDNFTSTMIIPINDIKTADYELEDILIVHYESPADFEQYGIPGDYKIVNEVTYPFSNDNFDLILSLDAPQGEYRLQSGGIHKVTKVRLTDTYEGGDKDFSIEGEFSASYVNYSIDKTLEISGKYRTWASTLSWY